MGRHAEAFQVPQRWPDTKVFSHTISGTTQGLR